MTEAMYLTCPHITKNILSYSLERIIDVENSACTFACMSCESVFPSLPSLKSHYILHNHEIFVRIGHRPDLYCCVCNDFQYCSYFDNIIGRKRSLDVSSSATTLFSSSNKGVNVVEVTVDKEQKSRKITPGLVNMGSTCFMNSVLQVLAHCREFSGSSHFISHIARCSHGNNTDLDSPLNSSDQNVSLFPACIPCEFYRVSEILSGDNEMDSFVIPSQLLYAVWSFVDYMAGYTQQDAHEFLIAFLNSLGSQLQTNSSLQDDFHKMFTGIVQSQLVCTVCGNTSTTNENFVDLSLTVDRYHHHSTKSLVTSDIADEEAMTLIESIEHFTATENLHEKVNCGTCGIEQERTKQLRLLETPNLLIFHFKRFDVFQQKKMTRKVLFPLNNLNLRKFAVNESENDYEYQLIGVVCHFGTLHQGHYISYIYDRKLCSWMKCDDENVTMVNESEVKDAEAYLLFYQRIQ